MNELPVREMVLYKHGVGFFVRQGRISGEKAELTFRKDEINDVLKSLAVFDESGGTVLGLHYQTPMDKAARLASSSIRLSESRSVRDLLRDLRGRQVTLVFEVVAGSVETVTGRIIGLDEALQPNPFNRDHQNGTVLISILDENQQVQVFPLEALRSFQIQDGQSEHDLSYFLDTSMSEDDRRIVNVRLSEGDHELAVYYVAPTPTWRVSYRLVAESDESGETGKALLQGWGLFDNRLEEDLNDVQVTLVAGQPISFIYELYASRIPERPTVQDETRIAPGPIEFEAALAAARDEDQIAYLSMPEENASWGRGPRAGLRAAAPAPKLGLTAQQSAPAQAEAKEAGEFFQYVVKNPVSVKRGESALVPIISSEIQYNRELLYNGAKLPKHPVAAMRFENTIGLTLERGPVTVVEDSDYKGEAVVPFTKDGNEVYLPYAVELGIKVTQNTHFSTQTVGLSIKNAFMIFDDYSIQQTDYTLENTTAKPAVVTIEAPILNEYESFDTPAPDVETSSDRRWRVSVPAHGKQKFTRSERRRTHRQQAVRTLGYKDLQSYLKKRWLDEATFNTLRHILDQIASIEKMQAERGKLTTERQDIYQKQEQLRANLQTLQPTGQEAALRSRMLGQLETTQNRLEEIDQRIAFLNHEEETTNQKIEEMLAALTVSS